MDNESNAIQSATIEVRRGSDDLMILNEILAAFRKLQPEVQERMLNTVATFLGIGHLSANPLTLPHQGGPRASLETTFSEDRSISPKQFMLEKQPKTDVERVACLAYYLTHYRETPHFKTLDISKLNTEAAQLKFSNAAVAMDNATKTSYLVPASKGTKQLSAIGEQFVLALPDRDKARSIMASARPRRKSRRTGEEQGNEQQ
ncbi:MAG TPA: hypothetical protein VGX94_02525 [Terriglobia bacterium]|nr:hypothetical protein [Terriglobia bacterium]